MSILDTAEAFFEVSRRPIRKVPTLRGKTILNLFYEASTRTRTSFELAGKRLSADVVNMSASSSSTTKGETPARHRAHARGDAARRGGDSPRRVRARRTSCAKRVGCAIVNAGDGLHEHPTQALLDAFTIRRAKGTLDGLKIAICGDVAHSRVARSNALLLTMFGNEVRFAGPRTLMPVGAEQYGVKVFDRTRARARGRRRGDDAAHPARAARRARCCPPCASTAAPSGSTRAGSRWPRPTPSSCIPGPMNRGVEIDPLRRRRRAQRDPRSGRGRRRRAHGGAVHARRRGAAPSSSVMRLGQE